ncbi:hypothetical protein NDU88_007515 [Pleurodeles waltl]|uniref:Uncharacterized protein n=1 Tax=Pleurodeles waltl TaxID=8319 RepID=A0AAV7U0P4_PLEWA|nr:hypothetical protein NDU88_007515 [Pleurodeles waltl]
MVRPPATYEGLLATNSWGPTHSNGTTAQRAPTGHLQSGSAPPQIPAPPRRDRPRPCRLRRQAAACRQATDHPRPGLTKSRGRGPTRPPKAPPAAPPLTSLQREHRGPSPMRPQQRAAPSRAERASLQQARRWPGSPPHHRPTRRQADGFSGRAKAPSQSTSLPAWGSASNAAPSG